LGAHPYQYVVEYRDDPAVALAELRGAVFHRGAYPGADTRPRTPEEAVSRSGETGTRSILDIARIAARPAHGCAAPLTEKEMEEYFETASRRGR